MRTNLQVAGTVARYVSLESVTLSSAYVTSSIDPISSVLEDLALENQYRAQLVRRDTEHGELLYVSVEFGFEASLAVEEAASENAAIEPAVRLNATFLLIYALREHEPFEEGALDHFASLNGPYNAWPYWRELVQSVAGRVGLSGIVLPVFRPEAKPVEEGSALGGEQPRVPLPNPISG